MSRTLTTGSERRYSLAGHGFLLATACAAALLLFSKGLSVFAAWLVVATGLHLVERRRVPAHVPKAVAVALRATLWMALAVLSVAVASRVYHGLPLRSLDHPIRLLLIPWCAWLAYVTGTSRQGLWLGAVVGVLIAFAIAVWQIGDGLLRADAGGNPIVFAHLVLALLAIALFCRPAGEGTVRSLVLLMILALGIVTVVLTGSRGALPGLAVLLLAVLTGDDRNRRGWRFGVALGLLAAAFVLLWSVPWLAAQSRLENVQQDLARYARGDVDSPIGARLQLLALAWRAFMAHPGTGTGIDRFGIWVDQLPGCLREPPMGMCVLEHAHNDLAEWAATLGIPGVLAIIAIYGVPLTLFVRIIRSAGPGPTQGAAWAGAMVVIVYVLSGLSQSMFAHAATASAYAIFVGALLGIALRERAMATVAGSGRVA